jgi:hypothetical protein
MKNPGKKSLAHLTQTIYLCQLKIGIIMIQRIQSIYLFLAIVAASLMFIFPLAGFYGDSNFILYAYQISFKDPDPSLQFNPYFLLPLMGLLIFIILLSTITLLSFKNRKRQLILTKIAMGLTLVLLAVFFFGYMGLLEQSTGTPPTYEFASFMPALVFLFLFLANRGILKDEKLIKSMDRLR